MSTAVDMHEMLITRGDIQGSPQLFSTIMVEQNCVLVHHGDCHIHAATEEGQRICIIHLLHYVPFDEIRKWLSNMANAMNSHVPIKALHMVEDVQQELEYAMQDLQQTNQETRRS